MRKSPEMQQRLKAGLSWSFRFFQNFYVHLTSPLNDSQFSSNSVFGGGLRNRYLAPMCPVALAGSLFAVALEGSV